MSRKILLVENSFLMKRRGVVVIAQPTTDFIDFRNGNSVEIKNPDGTSIVSKVSAIEFLSSDRDFENKKISFLAEDATRSDQIQKNATITLLESQF